MDSDRPAAAPRVEGSQRKSRDLQIVFEVSGLPSGRRSKAAVIPRSSTRLDPLAYTWRVSIRIDHLKPPRPSGSDWSRSDPIRVVYMDRFDSSTGSDAPQSHPCKRSHCPQKFPQLRTGAHQLGRRSKTRDRPTAGDSRTSVHVRAANLRVHSAHAFQDRMFPVRP